jgi:hypothetical protein
MRLIASVILVCSTITPICAQSRWHGTINDVGVCVTISQDLLRQSTPWDPSDESTPAPPISIHEAIRLAKSAVFEKWPDLKNSKWDYSISLKTESYGINDGTIVVDDGGAEWQLREKEEEVTRTTQAWVYCIQLSCVPPITSNGPTLPGPQFPVAVLLDGTVVLPTSKPLRIPQSILQRDYRRLSRPQERR